MAYVVVAGGVNVDISAQPFQRLRMKDSNPGRVRTGFGGVARNIAHNLRLLGAEVELLTALGDDGFAGEAEESCRALGIGVEHVLHVSNVPTSTYAYINDEHGDMFLAVSDMAICEELTPEYFASRQALLDGAALVIADTNLPTRSLVYLAENLRVPLFIDPVSSAKAGKLNGILPKIHTLKPNSLEAEILSGVPVVDRNSARRAARKLIELGVKQVFLSLGREGFLAAGEDETVWQPALPVRVRSATGAGDALMATLAWAWLRGENLSRTAALGAAAGAIAVESDTTINPAFSAETVTARAAD